MKKAVKKTMSNDELEAKLKYLAHKFFEDFNNTLKDNNKIWLGSEKGKNRFFHPDSEAFSEAKTGNQYAEYMGTYSSIYSAIISDAITHDTSIHEFASECIDKSEVDKFIATGYEKARAKWLKRDSTAAKITKIEEQIKDLQAKREELVKDLV